MDHYVSVWVNMAWITPILDVVQLAAVVFWFLPANGRGKGSAGSSVAKVVAAFCCPFNVLEDLGHPM